jgi:hypothetical protein
MFSLIMDVRGLPVASTVLQNSTLIRTYIVYKLRTTLEAQRLVTTLNNRGYQAVRLPFHERAGISRGLRADAQSDSLAVPQPRPGIFRFVRTRKEIECQIVDFGQIAFRNATNSALGIPSSRNGCSSVFLPLSSALEKIWRNTDKS